MRLLVLAVLIPGLLSAQTSANYIPFQMSSRMANRILEEATWGPTPIGTLLLQRQGFDTWFEDQIAAPVSTYTDQPQFNSLGTSNIVIAPVQAEFFQNALTGPDQLRGRVAFALSKIWVVSENELNNASAFPPILRLFQNDAFANYEQIMYDVTLSPAMGRYLNMVNNDKGNPAKGTSPNENYGREIMQLFTLGLTQLNLDGSAVVDAKNTPIPSYTQETVTAVSRAFTGWTYAPMPNATNFPHNPAYYLLPMVATAANHDTTQKLLFPGYTLPAGQTAEADLKGALHAIFMQPSIAPFISRQLIQNLTTSNPGAAYIGRVAEVFVNNGGGVRGDMKSVIRAILTDPEARAADAADSLPSPSYGHMREPVLLATNLLRALSGTLAPTSTLAASLSGLGQQLFFPPSVFSYFSPFYRTPSGLPAPEFQIYSTQSATNRINLVNSVVYNGQLDAGTKFNLSPFVSAAVVPANLVTEINTAFFHNSMSDSLKAAIGQAMDAVPAPIDKAKAALYIALTSGEFQIIN